MSLRATYVKKTFSFRFDARTSRGKMKDKTSWIIKVWDTASPSIIGYGECGPLLGLSIDDAPDFEKKLDEVIEKINHLSFPGDPLITALRIVPAQLPSILFAMETAFLDLANGGDRIIFKNSFTNQNPIPINGLVWMGDVDFMLEQVHKKVEEGYTCIKIKVGGLDFDEECRLLETIRAYYSSEKIILRLDANGAFATAEALAKLKTLAVFHIHSIEQPIKQGSFEMKNICAQSPIPVALDEELIGNEGKKNELLQTLHPSYIILKPTLHGGIRHCAEWIEVAENLSIGWWITSALESNIGLNAVCQFAANYNLALPQGLGTGALYDNNFDSPLEVRAGEIFYNIKRGWDINL